MAKIKTKEKSNCKRKRLLKKIPQLLEGKNLRELALESGYADTTRSYYGNDIKQQINKLMAIDKDMIQCEVDEVRQLALTQEKPDLTNALRASEIKAKLGGLLIDKSKQDINLQQVDNPNISNEELEKKLRQELDSIQKLDNDTNDS